MSRLAKEIDPGARDGAPLQLQREARRLQRTVRRRKRLRIVVRGLWLGLAVVAAGLAVRLVGYNVRWPIFVFPGAFVFATVVAVGWWSSPSVLRLARGYDRYFQLHELLATGLEVARRSQAPDSSYGPVEQRLIEQSMLATYALRNRVRARPLFPVRDVEMLLAVGLIAVGLVIAGRWSAIAMVAPIAIQPLPAPATAEPERTPNATAVPVAGNDSAGPGAMTPEDREAAAAIADGLRDSGAGRPAADALDRGDTDTAASKLRELADKADQLSPEARRDLSSGLKGAADRLASKQPDRADRLQRDAGALQGRQEAAAGALQDLAGLVDELGKRGPAAANGGSGAGQNSAGQEGQAGDAGAGGGPAPGASGGAGNNLGGESRGGATSPPSAAGEAMPLPPSPDNGGPRTSATGPQGPTVQLDAGGTRAAGSAGAAVDGGSDTPLSGEADPLRIPPEYRDVVQRYFSPSH